MRQMKDGGIGGVEIQPVYPVALDDHAAGIVTHPFLSDAFLDDVRFAARTARELGLRVDLTLGSGWPYGGPQVGIAQAAGKLRVERVVVPAGAARAGPGHPRGGTAARGVPGAARPADSPDGLREVRDIADGVAPPAATGRRRREVLFFISSRPA